MGSSLEELKSRLRSLVVSSPTRVDAAGLARDYRVMMGEFIPADRYGYRDVVSFLREKCADSFLFSGPSGNPVLTLIVTDTLKHIDGFVKKQRISSSAKFKGKRTSVPESMVRPQATHKPTNGTPSIYSKNNYYDKPPTTAYKPPSRAISKDYPPPNTSYHPPSTAYRPPAPATVPQQNKINTNQNNQRVQETQHVNVIHAVSNLHINGGEPESNESHLSNETSQTAVQKFLQRRLHSSSQHLDLELGDNDSGRQTLSSSGLSSKQLLLDDLRLEMAVLIADYPDGIWSSDLMRIYKARFGRELPLARVGYTNVVSLTRALGGVLRLSRPERTGDWRLLAARAASPPPPPPPPARPPPEPPTDPDDALPGVPFDPSVFPADCLHFVESIPAAAPPGEREGERLHVMVGEVYSPSHLWLLRLGAAHHAAMERVMDEMTAYYGGAEAEARRPLQPGAVRVGHYCAAPFEGDWHRALIVKLLDADTVKVRYVDYGTVARVAAGALRGLRRGWAALPAQALRARLAGLRPAGGGRRWPHAAARRLLQLVAQRRLVAQLVARDPQECILEVFLVDTSGAEDVCVNDALVAAGHAAPRSDSALASSEPHLYPTFAALEAGATPNLADIERFLAAGLQPRYVAAYRQHVAAGLRPRYVPPAPPGPVWLPLLELEVYRALAAGDGAAVAARHLAASLSRAAPAPPPPGSPALRLRALDVEVLAGLCAGGAGGARTALRFLDQLMAASAPGTDPAPRRL